MTEPRGFLQITKKKEHERPIPERVRDYREIVVPAELDEIRAQARRCMDCGVPFCHRGCPLGNLIPEWNDLVERAELVEAASRLAMTNNFPEITGRVCPAPCEASCVLDLEGESVTIKAIERTIADAELARGLEPRAARARSGRRAAVVGSGPAGLATAQELARKGHEVVVFERDDRPGGLLRYGIPDFKLEKRTLDVRLDQLRAEGVVFRCGASPTRDELQSFDAVVLAVGSRRPRDLAVPGRELGGVHFAMDYLEQQNRRVAGDEVPTGVVAAGKRVVVIGGGDTGSDCVGTAIRQGAASVLQLEILPRPSDARLLTNPWPEWPLVLRTSSSHEEGAVRDWAVMTRALLGEGGAVRALHAVRAQVDAGRVTPIDGSDFEIACDLVLLAMGFVGPEPELAVSLGVELDARGNVRTGPDQRTSVPNVFAAGDASRGQSLVVWAIADGRRAAASAHALLASH